MPDEYATAIGSMGGDIKWSGMAMGSPPEEESFLGSVNSAVVKGVPLVLGSAVSGLYNTIPLIANAVGGTGTMDYMSTLDIAKRMDYMFDTGDAMADYYNTHSEGIELTGSIVGAIAPGVAAVKAANMAFRGVSNLATQAATANSGHIVGKMAGWYTALTPTSQKTAVLRSGYNALLRGETITATLTPVSKIKMALASGQAAATEAVIFDSAATLLQATNPTYQDINDLGDFTKHLTTSALFGGGLGGAFGALFYKGSKFLPTADATTTTTLRDTANTLTQAREAAINIRDFAQKLDSVAPGTKIASLANDRNLTKEQLDEFVSATFQGLPPEQFALHRKLAEDWMASKNDTIEGLINTQVLSLVKNGDSSVGEDVIRAFIKAESGLEFPKTSEQISQLFGGARKLSPLQLVRNKEGGLIIKSVSQLDEEQAVAYRQWLSNSAIGKELQTTQATIKSYQDEFERAGLRRNPSKAEVPEALQSVYEAYRTARKAVLDNEGFQELIATGKDYSRLTGEVAKKLNLNAAEAQQWIDKFSFGSRPTNAFYLDLKSGKHMEFPTLRLGDFSAGKFSGKVNDAGNLTTDSGEVILGNARKAVTEQTFPEDTVIAQGRWVTGDDMARTGHIEDISYANGDANPFLLAAQIDSGKPIIYQGVEIPREVALRELTKAKKALYAEGVAKGLNDDAARLYADLPMDAKINEGWFATAGRENNFLERQNIVIEYDKIQPLTEFDLKTVAAMRANIATAQEQTRALSVDIAQEAGIEFPESVVNTLKGLGQRAINGEHTMPADMSERAGAGTITNASGRMFTLNTMTAAIGTFTRNVIRKAETAIETSLAPEVRNIVRGTKANEEKDILRLIHKKATGGGTRYHDIQKVLSGSDITPEMLGLSADTWVSREVAEALVSPKAAENVDQIVEMILSAKNFHVMEVDNPNVVAYLRKYSALESTGRKTQLNILAARGVDVKQSLPGELYFPPLDVNRSPYFAMVRDSTQLTSDGSSRYSFIHANTKEGLAEKANRIEKEFGGTLDIISKDRLQQEQALAGEFEYAKSFYAYNIDSKLHSKGIFSEFNLRNGDELMSEWEMHLKDQVRRNTRSLVRNMSGEFMDNNEVMSSTLNAYTKSVHGKAFGAGTKLPQPDNIYTQLNRTMMDIGPGEGAEGLLGIINRGQNVLVNFTDDIATRINDYAIQYKTSTPKVRKELEERLHLALENQKKLGVDVTLGNVEMFADMERRYGRQLITQEVQRKINSISTVLTLGLDVMNAVVQSISLPLTINSSIHRLITDASPEVRQAIEQIGIGGKAARLGTLAARDFATDIFNGNIKAYEALRMGKTLTKEQTEKLGKWLQTKNGMFFREMSDLGLIPPAQRQMMVEIESVSDFSKVGLGQLQQKFDSFIQLLSTPTLYAETFQRFAALKVAEGIAEVAGLQGAARLNMLHSFATQSAGVFTAAQRPGLFQGAIGSSFGLYKSYAINMLQGVGRHIEDRNVKALMQLSGIQGLTFGFSGVPGAKEIVNNYILSQNEEDRRDLYTTAEAILGRGAGNTMLYGLPSTFLRAGLYSRGDIRDPFSTLGNPLDVQSYPALNQFYGVVGSVMTAAQQLGQGANITTVMGNALAHQSLNRPVARIAEYMRGVQTTRNGTVIQNVRDEDNFLSLNLAIRLAGARPYDEAVTSDAYYRESQYMRDDAAAMKKLRLHVQEAERAGDDYDMDEVMDQYIKNGGNPRNFRNWWRSQLRLSNQTALERMQKKLQNSDRAGHLQQLDQPYLD